MITCPICLNNNWKKIFEGKQYAFSGVYFDLETSVKSVKDNYILQLGECTKCGFIKLINQDLPSIKYHSINRKPNSRVTQYTDEIITSIFDYNIDKKSLIVEIGSNDGSFLEKNG